MEYFLDVAREALSARCEVKTAGSVSEALEVLSQCSIDVVVIDLTLDGGDNGLGLLRSLQPKPCPIIVFTDEDEANIYGEKWDQLRASGADDLVLKGMNAGEQLVRKVGALLGAHWDDDET